MDLKAFLYALIYRITIQVEHAFMYLLAIFVSPFCKIPVMSFIHIGVWVVSSN